MHAPSEKHLEDWIVNNPSKAFYQLDPVEGVWDGKMPLYETLIARQARLPSGICDLVAADTYDDFHTIYAIELKKGAIDTDAICQCLRYIHDLKDFVQHAKMHTGADAFAYSLHWSPEIRGIVIGHWLKGNDIVTVADAANILPITYEYNVEADEYTFTPHEDPSNPNHHQTMIDYSYGAIGQAIKSLVHARIAYHKAYPHD